MELTDLSLLTVIAVLVAALLTAVLHGATGMAGGILLAAILSNLIGVKIAIPVMTIALVMSHASRVWLNFEHADWRSVRIVLLASTPTILGGSLIFTLLPPGVIALVMAVFLFLSLPVKRYASRHQLTTSDSLLAGASFGWGALAGNVVGPGFVLAPFLLGRGMNRMAFVASLAIIVLSMNVLKLTVFGVTELMTGQMFLFGVMIGLLTIPGNWLGKKLLLGMNDGQHRLIIDFMTVLVALNFAYLALSADW